jgi:hypothetical protein
MHVGRLRVGGRHPGSGALPYVATQVPGTLVAGYVYRWPGSERWPISRGPGGLSRPAAGV